jgi:type III restriction enzyme
MANESYEAFAAQLQKEIEQEEGIKFGVVEKHLFANMVVSVDGHVNEYLGVDASKTLWDHLKTARYIDAGGKVQEPLKKALKTGDLDLCRKRLNPRPGRLPPCSKKWQVN